MRLKGGWIFFLCLGCCKNLLYGFPVLCFDIQGLGFFFMGVISVMHSGNDLFQRWLFSFKRPFAVGIAELLDIPRKCFDSIPFLTMKLLFSNAFDSCGNTLLPSWSC